jgi:glycosyltransferase involved in cell wall biosynthesis
MSVTSLANIVDHELTSCCVIIPSLNPTEVLFELVCHLKAVGFANLVVIDDGSDIEYGEKFLHVERLGVHVIRHEKNLGKGRALKSGFLYACEHQFAYALTIDSDGQHTPEDAVKVARVAARRDEPTVVLGVRKFAADVPLRSRFGNIATQWIFKSLSGLPVGDTQTGLRAFPASLLPDLIALDGERYEYEMNVLMRVAALQIPVTEVPIQTIYLDGNSGSHFRPLIDSLRIYFVLFRDVFLSLSSFAIDIGLFTVGLAVSGDVTLATFTARAISGSYNFLGNKFFVFRRNGLNSLKREVIGYALLAFALATLSSFFVTILAAALPNNITLVKIGVDLCLYTASFLARRFWVFR